MYSLSLSLSRRIKDIVKQIENTISNYVPLTRKINNKALNNDISLTASDIGAAASSHTHSYLSLSGGTITGPLTINSSVNNNYNEGVRITRADNNWAGITFGSTGTSGAPADGWFAATNPDKQFIISPDSSSNTTGLTLNKNGTLKWRNTNVSLEGHTHSQYLTSHQDITKDTIVNALGYIPDKGYSTIGHVSGKSYHLQKSAFTYGSYTFTAPLDNNKTYRVFIKYGEYIFSFEGFKTAYFLYNYNAAISVSLSTTRISCAVGGWSYENYIATNGGYNYLNPEWVAIIPQS